MFIKYSMIILAIVLLSACDNYASDPEKARQSLASFFSELSNGNYSEAAKLYGGSYEILVEWNPEIDADDHIGLWENGCQINGLQCLTFATITYNERNDRGEYIFTVEFNASDGNLFILEDCCGEDQSTISQFQFEYRVLEGKDGEFRVLDIPVYMP